MGIVYPKEPSELAKKTFSGMVVMNLYPTFSKETREKILAHQKERQAEVEAVAKQKLEEKESLSGRQVAALNCENKEELADFDKALELVNRLFEKWDKIKNHKD